MKRKIIERFGSAKTGHYILVTGNGGTVNGTVNDKSKEVTNK